MPAAPSAPSFVLAGDIGGTHARLALAQRRDGRVVLARSGTFAVREHAGLADAIAAFLGDAAAPSRACIAWAGPIDGRRARLTNGAWAVDADRLQQRLGGTHVALVNDFHAAAAGIDDLDDDDLEALQPGRADPAGARLVIGAGTGLGVACALRDEHGTRIVAGEGGHVGFAPQDAEQDALLAHWRPVLGRVTAEHFVSGSGIARLYAFCCMAAGTTPGEDVARDGAAAVSRRAAAGEPAAERALHLFCAIFGAVAGDHALACLATGGVYVAGGVAARLAARLADGTFATAFRAKGVHGDIVARMPVWRVRDEGLGLRGAALLALDGAR